MKMVPCNIDEIKWFYTPGRNQKLIQEFINSDMKCVKIEDYPHKNAKSCQTSMIGSLKRMRVKTIKVMIRKDEVFLRKVEK